MDNCRPENNIEAKENLNSQCDRRPNPPCVPLPIHEVAGARGIDSSLLFFFLILVCIVCQSDCGIELDTLLWFFLLLVVLINQCDL